MNRFFAIVVSLAALAGSSAFAGVASTHCSDLSGTIKVSEFGGGHGSNRMVAINGQSLQELGLTETLGQSTTLESNQSSPFHSSRTYAVKAKYTDAQGTVQHGGWLLCRFSYGF